MINNNINTNSVATAYIRGVKPQDAEVKSKLDKFIMKHCPSPPIEMKNGEKIKIGGKLLNAAMLSSCIIVKKPTIGIYKAISDLVNALGDKTSKPQTNSKQANLKELEAPSQNNHEFEAGIVKDFVDRGKDDHGNCSITVFNETHSYISYVIKEKNMQGHFLPTKYIHILLPKGEVEKKFEELKLDNKVTKDINRIKDKKPIIEDSSSEDEGYFIKNKSDTEIKFQEKLDGQFEELKAAGKLSNDNPQDDALIVLYNKITEHENDFDLSEFKAEFDELQKANPDDNSVKIVARILEKFDAIDPMYTSASKNDHIGQFQLLKICAFAELTLENSADKPDTTQQIRNVGIKHLIIVDHKEKTFSIQLGEAGKINTGGTFGAVQSIIQVSNGILGEIQPTATHSVYKTAKPGEEISHFEIECMKKYQGGHTITFEGQTSLVTKAFECNLGEKIKSYQFTYAQKLDILDQIELQLAKMHADGNYHSDIKLENILFNMNQNGEIEVQITDFGLVNGMKPGYELYGSPAYTSPQRWENFAKNVDSKVPKNEKDDKYALGILAYQLIYSKEIPGLEAFEQATSIAETKNLMNPDAQELFQLGISEQKQTAMDINNELEEMIKNGQGGDPKAQLLDKLCSLLKED